MPSILAPLLLLLLLPLTQAQTISPGTSTYTYQGCYNETTNINGTDGARALSNGASESVQNMTVESCIAFCEVRSYTFAGLEYTRFFSPSVWLCEVGIWCGGLGVGKNEGWVIGNYGLICVTCE